MLATSGTPTPGPAWVIEPKADGWRCMVTIDNGFKVRTRSGRIVTDKLPDLAALAHQVPDGTVLDGELVAGRGRAEDFYRVAPTMARRQSHGLVLAIFDVPFLAGHDITTLRYRERRRLLVDLDLRGPAWCTLPSIEADTSEVLTVCERLGIEGVVAKRADSRYTPGKRSRSWVKVKCPSWKEQHAPLRHEREHRSPVGSNVADLPLIDPTPVRGGSPPGGSTPSRRRQRATR